MPAAVEITGHPERLSALCELWQRQRQVVHVTLQGNSMLPAIPPGSTLRLACGDAEFVVGEVLAVRQQDRLVIHRLIRIDRESHSEALYICRGDANDFADPPIPRSQIVGVVRQYRPPTPYRRIVQLLRRGNRSPITLLARLSERIKTRVRE
jgi:hypothetical protein